MATSAVFGVAPKLASAQTAVDSAPSNAEALQDVWRMVGDRFYDPKMHGLDWSAVRDRYTPEAARAASRQQLASVINAMLGELKASHTHYYTPDDPEYYQLADIFVGGLRRNGWDRAFPSGRVSYPGVGVLLSGDSGARNLVTGVIDGAPAKQAGLRVGDEIVTADGSPFEPVASFRDKVGKRVVLSLRRAGTPMDVPVTPADLEPHKMFLDGLNDSARLMEANGRRIGYVHVWSYASYAYQRALEHLISEGVLRDADALIWDLREGWGGAVPEYLDLFNARAPTMQVMDRQGDKEFENVKWRKPVAMLVNGATRSGKEVLAYGFKKYRLGEVIGTRTEGAVLAATAFLVGGGLLLLAVDDVWVDGERLEGVGVTPTIEVQQEPGKDTQLDRAVAGA